MAKRKNIGTEAAAFARTAQGQLSELKRSLQAAQDSLAGLHSALRVPVIKPPRGRIPGSRTRPSIFETAAASSLGGFLSREIVSGGGGLLDDLFGGGGDDFSGLFGGGNGIGGSFEQSSTQFAARLFDASMRGQRIR